MTERAIDQQTGLSIIPDPDCGATRCLISTDVEVAVRADAERLEREILAACPAGVEPRDCLEIVRQDGCADRIRPKGSP